MATGKDYLEFIMEQLPDGASYRPMMGEYVIYYRDKVAGGIYDDRFLVKPVDAAEKLMPNARREIPYEGAKSMLLVDNVEDRGFLKELLEAMYDQLPAPKKRKK
ncbi:MAG: competence protein TfoX [Firmicutes bacterium]|nr:competence protein TfoX [Bacillota bacterium]MBR6237059.1 competence protein TfoX [Bacillota bacterium]